MSAGRVEPGKRTRFRADERRGSAGRSERSTRRPRAALETKAAVGRRPCRDPGSGLAPGQPIKVRQPQVRHPSLPLPCVASGLTRAHAGLPQALALACPPRARTGLRLLSSPFCQQALKVAYGPPRFSSTTSALPAPRPARLDQQTRSAATLSPLAFARCLLSSRNLPPSSNVCRRSPLYPTVVTFQTASVKSSDDLLGLYVVIRGLAPLVADHPRFSPPIAAAALPLLPVRPRSARGSSRALSSLIKTHSPDASHCLQAAKQPASSVVVQ